MNIAVRRELLEQAADRILAADNDNKPKEARIRHRGGRPAWNWLAKHDQHGAACLWLVARRRLPQAANDNRADAAGMGLDRRKDGKPRGVRADRRDIGAYLALPAVQPRLGEADSAGQVLRGWDGESHAVTIKEQRLPGQFKNSPRGSYTKCLTAVAYGASFLGAQSGLGQPRPSTRPGDVRRVEEPEFAAPPNEVDIVIEAILARATVAGVGEALGARGGYSDRRGRRALLDAARWAKMASMQKKT